MKEFYKNFKQFEEKKLNEYSSNFKSNIDQAWMTDEDVTEDLERYLSMTEDGGGKESATEVAECMLAAIRTAIKQKWIDKVKL